MSSLINKVKSHLHHDSTVSNSNSNHQATSFINPNGPNPAGGLQQTYHQQNTVPGPIPNTIVHKQEDHWQGPNTHVEKQETIIENKVPLINGGNLIGAHNNLKPGYAAPRSTPLGPQAPLQAPLQTNLQPNLDASRTVIEPSIQRSVVEKPAIIKETLLPEERIEIQPVIHREREQKEVHKIVQPLRERDILPTKVVQATLAEQVRAPVFESDAGFQTRSRAADTQYVASKEYATLKTQTVQKPAIVEEHIHKTIVEEIQPVLYKETIVPVVIQETQPIYEKIVEAPTIITEERAVRDLGTQFHSTSLNDQQAYQSMGQGVIPQGHFVQQTTITQTVIPNQYVDQNKLNQQTGLYQKNPLNPNINNTRLV